MKGDIREYVTSKRTHGNKKPYRSMIGSKTLCQGETKDVVTEKMEMGYLRTVK